jgi:hypothetical protein
MLRRGCCLFGCAPGKTRALALLCCVFAAAIGPQVLAQYPSSPQIFKDGTAVSVQDYASLPLSSRTTGSYPPPINYGDQLGRVNFLRSEPPNAPLSSSRFFVNDLNRSLYLLNKTNKAFTVYINFETVFPNFVNVYQGSGWACGLVTFAFDPNYASNGKFYTVHVENPLKNASAVPTNGALPGFDLSGYTTTAVVNPPAGSVPLQDVLIEWTDTNINNATFEGTARELLRIGFNDYSHPMGDLIFDPLASPGSADYGNLYVAVGDGLSGETSGDEHPTPQRLDALQGKILRITPDLTLRTNDALSANGRYRIPTTGPSPNPFVSVNLTGLKTEIFSYGHRNPHRLSWDPISNKLIVCEIGLISWEEVNFITAGANYGYAEREGIEQLFICGCANNFLTGSQISPPVPFPNPDTLAVTGLVAAVTPVYPVATYSHQDGDAISSGFVYRGSLMPGMNGKFVFGDITTARIFYCNLANMIAADDGNRTTVAPIHELQIVYNGTRQRMFDVVAAAFHQRNGTSSGKLPGRVPDTNGNDPYGVPYGYGRADIRLAMDGQGELYILSKADGMIRKIVGQVSPPTIQSVTITNGVTKLTWTSISNVQYRAQYSSSLSSSNWTSLAGDVTAAGASASKTDAVSAAVRFYRVLVLP